MRARTRIWAPIAGLGLIVAVSVVLGVVLASDRLDRVYAEGTEAAEADEWSTALVRFREVVRAGGGYRDAEAMLAAALDHSTVEVAAGWFGMGSESGRDDERPRRVVYLDAFELDRYEVTNAQYRRFLVASGRSGPRYWAGGRYPEGQADLPVVGVGWADACAYCEWAGKRLPTEAEWEKACRGEDGRTYAWGERWDPGRANVASRRMRLDGAWPLLRVRPAKRGERPGLEAVGSRPAGASPYGVMDLAGNASELARRLVRRRGLLELAGAQPRGPGPSAEPLDPRERLARPLRDARVPEGREPLLRQELLALLRRPSRGVPLRPIAAARGVVAGGDAVNRWRRIRAALQLLRMMDMPRRAKLRAAWRLLRRRPG